MEKKLSICLILCVSLLFESLLISCTNGQESEEKSSWDSSEVSNSVEIKNSEDKSAGSENSNANLLLVMVNGEIYQDMAYINSSVTCGTADGVIVSSVDANKAPEKNDESNFGVGYEYQYWDTGYINVRIDDKWRIFQNLAMNSWIIPDCVAHFTAEIQKITEDSLFVQAKKIPQKFKWIFNNPMQESGKNNTFAKLISLPIDKFEHSVDGKTITTDGLVGKTVEVWFDGTLNNRDAEPSGYAEIGEVYKIQVAG